MSQRQPYHHEQPPYEPAELPSYLARELRRIERAINGLDPALTPKWRNADVSLVTDAGAPTFATFKGNTNLYWFSASDAVHFSLCLPTDYSEGTSILPIINWVVTSTASTVNEVVWSLDYTLAAPSATYGATITLTATATAGTIDQHMSFPMGTITATAATINSVIVGRLHRSGGNYAGKAGLLNFAMGYQTDDLGSQTQTTK